MQKQKHTHWIVLVGLLGLVGLLRGASAENGHREHDEHEEDVVQLSAAEMREFGVEVATAGPGGFQIYITLAGEIIVNSDLLAHIVPRIPGIAHEVRANLGDHVGVGAILAVLESRELSELKSAYLVAKERVLLATSTFAREEKLWKENISSEREFLVAKQKLAEVRIEMRAAEQKLHALGFFQKHVENLSFEEDEQFTRYEMLAPFEGTVIEKHIALGEVLNDAAEAFVIADLSSVWVNLTVYQKDLARIGMGQPVWVTQGNDKQSAEGIIQYISPIVEQETRTAIARVVLPNSKGQWRPGSFINGHIAIEDIELPLVLPKNALQTVEGQTVVFVETEEGFAAVPVGVGRTNRTHVEILHGVAAAQRYVAKGAFVLKSQLAKSGFASGHNH